MKIKAPFQIDVEVTWCPAKVADVYALRGKEYVWDGSFIVPLQELPDANRDDDGSNTDDASDGNSDHVCRRPDSQ